MRRPNPGSSQIKLEICVSSVEDCISAEENGADRLELNSALVLGGLTPSLGTVIEARRRVAIPVMAMARPRPGGFHYSAVEFATMQRDIQLMLDTDVDGIVFGVLNADGTLDVKRCQRLVAQIHPRQAVFHRAFDVVPDAWDALDALIDLGVDRLLTSGQEASAYNGAATIAALMARAGERIEILPAGGINRFTVQDVLARTGCTQVHASLSGLRADGSTAARPQVRFNASTLPPEDRFTATDGNAVRDLRHQLDCLGGRNV